LGFNRIILYTHFSKQCTKHSAFIRHVLIVNLTAVLIGERNCISETSTSFTSETIVYFLKINLLTEVVLLPMFSSICVVLHLKGLTIYQRDEYTALWIFNL